MELLGTVPKPTALAAGEPEQDQFIGAIAGAIGGIVGNAQQRKMQKEDQKLQREQMSFQRESETNGLINSLLQNKLASRNAPAAGGSTPPPAGGKGKVGLYVGIGAGVLLLIGLVVVLLVQRN